MILGICENIDVLKVMNIVVTIIKIIQIVVPIVLMFSLMFKMIGAMTKHDDDAIANLKKKAVPNIVAAVLIFIVPLLVGIIMNVTFPDSEYTKCIVGISSEKIQEAYEDKAERLVSKAEETLNINDYVNAMNYMPNVKDKDKRRGYEERLEAVKALIDAQRKTNSNVEYMDYGPCKVEYKIVYVGHDKYEYGICVPEQYDGQKLPLIIFLHGMTSDKESSFYSNFYTWSHTGFNGALNDWPKFGLKNIPAIMIMPWSKGPDKWNNKWKYIHIDAIYNETINNYNIDTDNVCLMGASIGGQGVFTVAAEFPTRFKSIVAMSALITKPITGDIEYFENMPMKGFAEKYVPATHSEYYNYERKMTELFNNIGHPDDLRIVPVKHGDVPEYALTIDENEDGISDLIYWIINGGKDPE